MLQFADCFVIQIIGLLVHRKFSGDCNIRIEAVPACLQFADGALVHAFYKDLARADALEKIMWVCRGNIELVPQNYTASDWDYMDDMDKLIAEYSPPMPEKCPFIKNLSLEKSKHGVQNQSIFMETGQLILNNIRSSMSTDIIEMQKKVPDPAFWKSFFHLVGSGKVVGDYGQNLSLLLLKAQGYVIANLQKILGKRVADLYQERLSQEMDEQWPNFPKHKNYDRVYGAYDRIYGTAPYRTWAALLSQTITKAVSTAMGHSCYKKALALLKPEETELLQQLLDQEK